MWQALFSVTALPDNEKKKMSQTKHSPGVPYRVSYNDTWTVASRVSHAMLEESTKVKRSLLRLPAKDN